MKNLFNYHAQDLIAFSMIVFRYENFDTNWLSGLKRATNLKLIQLGKLNFKKHVLEMLNKLSSLRTLKIDYCNTGPCHFDLCDKIFVSINSYIQYLSLDNVKLDDNGLLNIAKK